MIVKTFDLLTFGAQPGMNATQACQAVSADILAHPFESYKLIVPSGDYFLDDTWEIPTNAATVIIEAEVAGTAFGPTFRPSNNFYPLVTLGTNYVPFVRDTNFVGDSFTTPTDQAWINKAVPGYDPNDHFHCDYRALIRLRGMGEGSAFRGITINGRDQGGVARLGKGLWIDGLWKPDDSGFDPLTHSFTVSNGLLIDSCKVNGVYAVTENQNFAFSAGPKLGVTILPWLPAIAIQVGSANSDGATRQVANVRIHRSYVFGALGSTNAPLSDPFDMRTDLGILFVAGNMKNYVVSECNIGFCRYGIRTAGSGYTNVMSCDFAANGSGTGSAWWDDGADLLVPQAQVNVIGCGSEGSRRFVQGDGAPAGFGALDIDACYWDGILPIDVGPDVGFVIRNLNQAGYIRGLRVVTGGPGPGRAGKAAIQIHGICRSLVLVNSHIDGIPAAQGDPLIYDFNSPSPILAQLEELAPYSNTEAVRIFVQNCTSRGYDRHGVVTDVVPLQNYDHSGVKRIGGNSVKVTLLSAPGQMLLSAWHHTIVADATPGAIELFLPTASSCQGREYVIKRMDGMPAANPVNISGVDNTDMLDGVSPIKLTLKNLQVRRLVSTGSRGWIIVSQ